jgi:hypothetical protein
MTEKEIITGNKMIAKFDGWVEKNQGLFVNESEKYSRLEQSLKPKTFNLLYHSSWDWLMPVIDKIDGSVDGINAIACVEIGKICCKITPTKYSIKKDALIHYKTIQRVAIPKIEAVWKTVVAFIEWHNKQKKSSGEKTNN